MMSAYAENSTPPAGDNTTNPSPKGTRCSYNYSRINGCLININRFRSKNMQGRNAFGGFQKGFTVKQDGSRQGRVHQSVRGRMNSNLSKQERERMMDEKMRQMSPASAARYIESRLNRQRDQSDSRSRSSSYSSRGSRRRGRSGSPSYSHSRSRSRSYSRDRSYSRSRSHSRSPHRAGRHSKSPSSRTHSVSRSKSRSPRARSHSHSRTHSRSRSGSHRRSGSYDEDNYRHRRRRSKKGRRRHRYSDKSDDEDGDKKSGGIESISVGDVMLSVPLDTLTEDEQKKVQEKREEMSTEFRQDCDTVIQVARLFSNYSRHERDLEKMLRRSLAAIGQRYVSDFEGWLKETIPHSVETTNQTDTAIEAT
ncbi:serine/arginine-rich splicing factor 4-like isoform X2 [Sycon ciliatum]|uniref:serine/arginine-rich splicing factor 4-like isoform X2 n=1 Tax=Sycon ciliatum TaxID=27933 RepID=UPI0031F703F6